jgi:hypothetical protein
MPCYQYARHALVGLGFFAFDVGLGFQPPLFSLTMVETYSAVALASSLSFVR